MLKAGKGGVTVSEEEREEKWHTTFNIFPFQLDLRIEMLPDTGTVLIYVYEHFKFHLLPYTEPMVSVKKRKPAVNKNKLRNVHIA
jgi:hypothetical protein